MCVQIYLSCHRQHVYDKNFNVFQKARRLLRLAPTPVDDFAERFKYDVISSSLLNSTLSVTPSLNHGHQRRRSMSPTPPVPGQMPSTPITSTHPEEPSESPSKEISKTNDEVKSMSGAFVLIGLAAMLNQHRLAAALAMVSSLFFTRSEHSHSGRLNYISQAMDALEALKAAANVWDSVVSDTMELLEGEERSMYFTAVAPPHSPSSPLRIALHSSLTTTQQQCDNVRPLLAALSSPTQLSQLSEMYAPPVQSPAKGTFKLSPNARLHTRSSPTRPSRYSLVTRSADLDDASDTDIHTTPTPRDKRSTWNGPYTYMSLANFDKPSSRTQVMRHRARRRSDVRSLVVDNHSLPLTSPTTPQTASSLPNVPEAEGDQGEETDVNADHDQFTMDAGPSGGFGRAALSLRRRRRAAGFQSLGLVSSLSDPALRTSPSHTPGSTSSRFTHTPLQIPRHPLSLPALRMTLHSALAARRYACAHLLALRFSDESDLQGLSGNESDSDDEAYWENVMAVVALLTSTLEDASSRLGEALEEAVGRVGMGLDGSLASMQSPSLSSSPPGPSRIMDGMSVDRGGESLDQRLEIADTLLSWRGPMSIAPFPTSVDQNALLTPRKTSPSYSKRSSQHLSFASPPSPLSVSSTLPVSSFAPAPTRLARFAEHVDAISGALEDAKGHLTESVRELREAEGMGKRSSFASSSTGASSGGDSGDNSEIGDAHLSQEDVALQAYDRLRRELGLALRECERGRGVLLNIIEARRRKSQILAPRVLSEHEDDDANSPTSAADPGSGDSESDGKQDGLPATPNDGSPILTLPSLESVLASQYQPTSSSRLETDDDATQHLLLTSMPSHLPAPGAEQVFECELGPEAAPTFTRERSKLTRAERIKLVKSRRESGRFGPMELARADREREQSLDRERRDAWGPGTEVVQELKDVIWKVSEKKRRMGSLGTSGAASTPASAGVASGDESSTASPQSATLSLTGSAPHSTPRQLPQVPTSDDYVTTLETI